MLIYWIWLATRSGVSDRLKRVLLERFHDAEGVYFAKAETLREVAELTPQGLEALLDKKLDAAERILIRCANEKIQLLHLHSDAYPARLRGIVDPPVVLYYKGRLPRFGQLPMVGVVGTRKATSYGLSSAGRLGYQIAKCGGGVVSGCAKGIDAVAMNAAMKAQGTVVGVLGCGVDVVYPVQNRQLFEDVIRNGCLISEFPPGTKPAQWNFPKRNRIISGLCDGVLVVEAPQRSGALITARTAMEQGRDVFAVPGNIDVAACAGSNGLLRDGAVMAQSGWDILSEYQEFYPQAVVRFDGVEPEREDMKVADIAPVSPAIPAKNMPERKKEIDNGVSSPYIDGDKLYSTLSKQEKMIVDCLKAGPCVADTLIAQWEGNTSQALCALTMLEVKGIIRRLPGNQLALK